MAADKDDVKILADCIISVLGNITYWIDTEVYDCISFLPNTLHNDIRTEQKIKIKIPTTVSAEKIRSELSAAFALLSQQILNAEFVSSHI